MFYEPYREKRRRRRHGCLGRLIRLVFLLAALFCVYALIAGGPIDKILHIVDPGALSVNNALPVTSTNVLLLGVDHASDGGSRSDSMIVASVGLTGSVKLASVMRDTWVTVPGHGAHKINAAYRLGGAQLAMRTVNEAFGMNITRYAVVDFAGFAGMIDAIGGIELDITKEEAQAVNKLFSSPTSQRIMSYGANTHVNGGQALLYARIRKLDSDYQRANRQRKVIGAILARVKSLRNPAVFIRFCAAAMQSVQTNIPAWEMIALGAKALIGVNDMPQTRIPFDGAYESGTRDGIWAIYPDLSKNRELLRQFIYG